MSNTNTAIKIVPQSDQEIATRVKMLRDQVKDMEDEIRLYTGMLQERAAANGVTRIKAGIYDVLIVSKGRDNFSLSEAKKRMATDEYNRVITPFLTRSEWKEVQIRAVDLGKNTDSDC